MAKFPFEVWLIRKNQTYENIVAQGITNIKQLASYLDERGISLPQDISYFHEIWNKAKTDISKNDNDKLTFDKNSSVISIKKTTKTRSKVTRKKTNIKDRPKKI
jgi:hypothetical protein